MLELYKIDPAFVFREAGLDPTLMDKPRERYKTKKRVAAWIKGAEPIDDPCFGLKIAECWSPTDLHALGYAFLASVSDLSNPRISAADVAGVQPSVGDSVDRYQGWAEGNPDLFKASGTTNSTDDPDIYMNVSGNPDLGF